MADKRATPEAPQESDSNARGKKRAAPTIDLTATELPRQPAAENKPPPEADTHSGSPPEQPATGTPQRTAHLGGLAIAAGAGAACVVLILFGLWLAGMLPATNSGSATSDARQVAALEKQIDAIGQHIAAQDARLNKLPATDTGVAEKLTAADSAMKSLGVTLAAITRRTDDTAVNAANAQKAADTATKATAELQASMKGISANGHANVARADIEVLEKRMSTLETSVKTERETTSKNSANDTAARLALSAVVLRDAVIAGAPYAGELAAVQSLSGDDKVLTVLAPFATTGVPDKKMLARELGAQIPGMLKLSSAKAPVGGFLEKLEANASRLVKVRPLNAPQGDDVSTVMARLEIAAASADVDGALADLARLPDKVRMPADAWINKAKARQAAIDAARQFAANAARSLASRAPSQ